jgi:hypothetical protein
MSDVFPGVFAALDTDRVGARSCASGFRIADSWQPGLAICRRDALRAGRDRHRRVPGDVQQIAATGAIDELFCQPAAKSTGDRIGIPEAITSIFKDG